MCSLFERGVRLSPLGAALVPSVCSSWRPSLLEGLDSQVVRNHGEPCQEGSPAKCSDDAPTSDPMAAPSLAGREVVAMDLQKGDGDDKFTCSKCGELVSMQKLAAACKRAGSKSAKTEELCMASYKTFTRRWAKKKRLKEWWTAKTPDQQKTWFREQKQMNDERGACGKMTLSIDAENVAGAESRARIWWKPYGVFEAELKKEGWSHCQAILAEWRRRLMCPEFKKKKFGDQWHLGEYQDVMEDNVDMNLFRRKLAEEHRDMVGSAALERAMEQADKSLEEARRARAKLVPPPSADDHARCPDEFIVGASEQEMAAIGVGALMETMRREVSSQEMRELKELQEEMEAQEFDIPDKEIDQGVQRNMAQVLVARVKAPIALLQGQCAYIDSERSGH